jgi:hypothetical protein
MAQASARREAGPADALTSSERVFLLHLQHQALRYFLDNFHPCGLVLDRQSNHGPQRAHGLCSLAATGMGCIALALAAAPPYLLLSPSAAGERLRHCLEAIRDRLPHEHGVVPHFVHSANRKVHGSDHFSTIETAWVVAGALWAAAFLESADLQSLAGELYDRVDWRYWTTPPGERGAGLLRHGMTAERRFLGCCWDRLNGETAFMYVLATGATEGRDSGRDSWAALQTFHGSVAGLRFNNADLGLFVFQYGMDLLDLERWQVPGEVDLWAEAAVAADANERACRAAADTFATYRHHWGLSAGDGPGQSPEPDVYRTYSPAGPLDGTAHLMATLASVAHRPAAVLENLYQGDRNQSLPARGRYGFSNVNLDCAWVGRDMVGIDAGAAVLALDNYLHGGRVRAVFHGLPCVGRALERLGFRNRTAGPGHSPDGGPPTALRAS